MIFTEISGKAESCAASVKPADPRPMISTSNWTEASPVLAASVNSGSPGRTPFKWHCMRSFCTLAPGIWIACARYRIRRRQIKCGIISAFCLLHAQIATFVSLPIEANLHRCNDASCSFAWSRLSSHRTLPSPSARRKLAFSGKFPGNAPNRTIRSMTIHWMFAFSGRGLGLKCRSSKK